MSLTYIDAILHLRPGVQVALVGGQTYAHIQWGAETPIAKADLDTALDTVRTAHEAAAAARAAQAAADTAARDEARADTVVQYLRDHTPAECAAYVQTNVTDLASARQMLKKFAIVLCVLAKQTLR